MIRRLAVTVLCVSSFALPRDAAAEPPGGTPLATICNSWQMEYCVRFLTHQVIQHGEVGGLGIVGSWSSTIEIFGSGYEAIQPGELRALYMNEPVAECRFGLAGVATAPSSPWQITGPGTYRIGDSSGSGDCARFGMIQPEHAIDGMPLTLSPTEIETIWWLIPTTEGGSCSPRAGTCYVVPEPGSMLLLATGGFGLAFVGWRRRRSADGRA